MSAVLVSDQYFKKKKAFAFGIVMSGSGVGSIIIPFVMRPLFDNYDFTGAMLLYGELIQEFMCMGSCLLWGGNSRIYVYRSCILWGRQSKILCVWELSTMRR